MIYAHSLIDVELFNDAAIDQRQRVQRTPDLQTGAVWYDSNERAHIRWELVDREGAMDEKELRAALELPRIYHLLKLCFVGGRLPRRPSSGLAVSRSGEEPFPPECLDILTLIQAGRVSEACQVAARRLRAKGYPTVLRDADLRSLEMDQIQCRRMAGILLIPIDQPGVLAALAIKPEMIVRQEK